MEIQSKVLGKIEYTQDSVIHFDEGLIGIPEKKQFLLIEKEDFLPFCYLQSVDDPSFVLIVINPLMVEKDYKFDIYKEDLKTLKITDENDFSLFAIVIFAQRIEDITLNLRAPIVINVHHKQALQVILQNEDYTVEEPLIRQSTPTPDDARDIFKM